MKTLLAITTLTGTTLFSMIYTDRVIAEPGYFEGLSQFINIPSLLIVVGPTLFFCLAYNGWHNALNMCRTLVRQGKEVPPEQIHAAQKFFRLTGNAAIGIGFIGVVIGWIAMNHNMDDILAFGPASQVSLLTLLYALLIKIPCYWAECKMRHILMSDEAAN